MHTCFVFDKFTIWYFHNSIMKLIKDFIYADICILEHKTNSKIFCNCKVFLETPKKNFEKILVSIKPKFVQAFVWFNSACVKTNCV
jgi:hypothetical protein